MKLALVQCPVWGTYDPPLALAQLSGCLKQAGHEVSCFDLNIRFYLNRDSRYRDSWAWEQSLSWYSEESVDKFFKDNKSLIEKCADELIATGPKIVGFSVNAASRLSSLKIAKMIRDIDKDIVIVFGGPLFFEKRFVGEILSNNCVDVVVPGEGESAFVELADLIYKKKDISCCSGLSYKKDKEIVNTKPRGLIEDLDTLPFMDFTDLPLSRYDDSRHIVFMASRGCVQRCAFCSSRAFWPKYRAMSGKRIFEEIKYHKMREISLNPHLGHIGFIDLMFNGNIKYLVEFCDLMIKERMDIKWSANMIIRPEMDRDVIRKMRDSGCEHIIFGIESGSQRVLNLMKKHYRIEDADRIIRDMHNAGICVTGNFMFGFPGETENDFKETLAFITRNSGSLDRAYPSRTYCAIEEFSYLSGHLEEFGIKPNPPNHLFWESVDGTNTYPERLRRCREFSRLASSLNIDVGCGVQTSVDLDEYFNLYLYYEQKKDMKNAAEYLLKYFKLNRLNEHVKDRLQFYLTKVSENDPLFSFDKDMMDRLKKAVFLVQKSAAVREVCQEDKSAGNVHVLTVEDNSNLNDAEFTDRKLILNSVPKQFFIESNGPCLYSFISDNQNRDYDLFSLKTFRSRFEERIMPVISKAEEVIFFGNGEFLLLDEGEAILDYFDKNLSYQTKTFITKGYVLSQAISEKIASLESRFFINVVLPAFSRERYRIMASNDNMPDILRNLDYLLKTRANSDRVKVNIVFIITTLNVEELPDMVRLAADLGGVNKVILRHASIYHEKQTYLSCYFRQSATNKAISEAIEVANNMDLKIDVLPYFGKDNGQGPCLCCIPWSSIKFDNLGRVLVCKKSNKYIDNIITKDFLDVWNGASYQAIRKIFAEKNCPYFNRCVQANRSAVNNFDAHKAYCTDEREVF